MPNDYMPNPNCALSRFPIFKIAITDCDNMPKNKLSLYS